MSLLGCLLYAPVYADCLWHSTATTWIDENADGRWEAGEAPLAGVRFAVADTRQGHKELGLWGDKVSNAAGRAQFSIESRGCPRAAFELSAEPPPGYRATAPSRVRVPGRHDDQFSFGFTR